MATKVHIIFTNEVLLKKDRNDFADLWKFSGLEDVVEYHSDINFSILNGEIIIFDEADEYIYNNAAAFNSFVGVH